MRIVKVPAFEMREGFNDGYFRFPPTLVGVANHGEVWTLVAGEPVAALGTIKHGTRTYSPPTHPGSRIARFHRQVPEWQARARGVYRVQDHFRGNGRYRIDTRQGAIAYLIACAAGIDPAWADSPNFR